MPYDASAFPFSHFRDLLPSLKGHPARGGSCFTEATRPVITAKAVIRSGGAPSTAFSSVPASRTGTSLTPLNIWQAATATTWVRRDEKMNMIRVHDLLSHMIPRFLAISS